jgi:hypothetical protein
VPLIFTGTYSVNGDGTGTILLIVTLPGGSIRTATEDFVVTRTEVIHRTPVATDIVRRTTLTQSCTRKRDIRDATLHETRGRAEGLAQFHLLFRHLVPVRYRKYVSPSGICFRGASIYRCFPCSHIRRKRPQQFSPSIGQTSRCFIFEVCLTIRNRSATNAPWLCLFNWTSNLLEIVICTVCRSFRLSLEFFQANYHFVTFYSLNGTPNASRAVLGGRCCAPITFGCLPIAFQIRSATAFIYSSRTCSRTLPR